MATGGAEELFAKKLANNEKKIRDKAVIKLRAWIGSRPRDGSGFQEVDLLKIWKGLFYCMWMSDKPLIQEELASNISLLIHSFKSAQSALLFTRTFFKTMEREWHGIDRLRLDKFYMLIRFVAKQTFCFLKEHHWDESLVNELNTVYQEGPLNPTKITAPDGIRLHMSAIYLPELGSVIESKGQPGVLLKLLDPLFLLAAHVQNKAVSNLVKKSLFENLVEEDKSDTAEEQEQSPFQVDFAAVISRLFTLASDKNILGRNRNQLFQWVKRLRKLSKAGHNAMSETQDQNEISVGMKRKDAPCDSADTNNCAAENSEVNNHHTGEGKPKRKKKKRQAQEEVNQKENEKCSDGNLASEKVKGKQRKEETEIVDIPARESAEATGGSHEKDVTTVERKSKKKKRKSTVDNAHNPSTKETGKEDAENGLDELVTMNVDNKEEEKTLVSTDLTDVHVAFTNGFDDKKDISVLNGDIDVEHSQAESGDLLQSRVEARVLRKTRSQTKEPFAMFQKNSTPPAFVRRSLPKTPRTDPQDKRKLKEKDLNPESMSANKKVRIEVSKNTSHTTQDYQRTLKESPKIPFDAERTPTQGLLKSPPNPTRTPLNVVKSASLTDPGAQQQRRKRTKNSKRPKAVDFF